MFLDEPTSGLDPVAAREVHDLINGLRRKGVTIFLTTHRLEEAEKLCDRVAILNTTLRPVGRPEDLREQLFKHGARRQDRSRHSATPTSSSPTSPRSRAGVPTIRRSYELSVSDPRSPHRGDTGLVGAGADVLSIGEARHSLEDVYLELIDEDVEARRP